MAKKVFVASTEQKSGKSMITIGLINAFLGIFPRVGYMKPVGRRTGGAADEDAALIKLNYGFHSDLIAGSMKTQNHVLACLRAGIDIATVNPDLFFQMFKHPLTDAGLAQFLKDAKQGPK